MTWKFLHSAIRFNLVVSIYVASIYIHLYVVSIYIHICCVHGLFTFLCHLAAWFTPTFNRTTFWPSSMPLPPKWRPTCRGLGHKEMRARGDSRESLGWWFILHCGTNGNHTQTNIRKVFAQICSLLVLNFWHQNSSRICCIPSFFNLATLMVQATTTVTSSRVFSCYSHFLQ